MTKKEYKNHQTPYYRTPIIPAAKVQRSFMTTNLVFLILTIVIMTTPARTLAQKNSAGNNRYFVILDFESDEQLNELSWKCGTTYERTKEHTTSGDYSLKIEMYPQTTWPGFGKGIKKSWAGYNYLSINIFNPVTKPIRLSYRIDDRRNSPPHADRANGHLLINPGPNTITFNLKELKTSGSKRPLNLDKICSFLLFLHEPKEKITLFLDDLTLSAFPPESK